MVRVCNDSQRDTVVSCCVSIREPCSPIRYRYPIPVTQRGESPEMTLIATVWSPEGFAMAADGLEVIEKSGSREYGDVQKIFSTSFAHETGFAWAWCGNISFTLGSGHHFDFKEITQRVMEDLEEDTYKDNPETYFGRVARRIYIELPDNANLSGLIGTSDEVIFVGYLNAKPLWAKLSFPHTDTGYTPPSIDYIEHSPRYFNPFVGSETIRAEMEAKGTLSQPLYLRDAVNSVEIFAETCVASRERVLDCANFGGTVHVATLTKEGFTWIRKPKNLL